MMPSKCTKQTKVFRIFIYSMTVIAVLLLFSACIGVESSITIREDGTGTVALSYRISHKVAHLGRLDEKDPLVPLPVNNDDFERTVANTDGISLLSSEQNEDEQNVYINADFRFDSVEALSGLFSTSQEEESFTLEQDGNETVFRYRLFSGLEQQVDPDTMTMIHTYFNDYTLEFTLNTPDPITGSNIGTVSDNSRSISFSTSIPELLENNSELVWEVRW